MGFAARTISILIILMYPLVIMIRAISKWLTPKEEESTVSREEISAMSNIGVREGVIDSDENKVIQNIMKLDNVKAFDAMTPRIVATIAQENMTLRSFYRNDNYLHYSRIPVYSGNRDNIKGVLYIKDLLPHLSKGSNFRWQSLIRPAYFVPETKMIDDLLRDFQANKIHIAIVVDEFGGTSGIVTMEDIIEEIVGEIHDEYDDEESTYTQLDNHTWVFEGKTLLTDFYKVTHLDEDLFDEVAGDADTLAGLMLELKGEFPKRHEKVTYQQYELEVLEMDKRRILKIKFTINPSALTAEEEA